jgi:hypothetical protein
MLSPYAIISRYLVSKFLPAGVLKDIITPDYGKKQPKQHWDNDEKPGKKPPDPGKASHCFPIPEIGGDRRKEWFHFRRICVIVTVSLH